jgi:hypothetical protein
MGAPFRRNCDHRQTPFDLSTCPAAGDFFTLFGVYRRGKWLQPHTLGYTAARRLTSVSAKEHLMAQRHVESRPGEMHDTIETTALTGNAGAAAPARGAGVEKICCSCGKNVVGQKRFKDADGRYWCYDCGVEDHIAKHPEDGIACAECGGKFAPSKLVRFDDEVYCEPCVTKKQQQKKREEHRKAAVEQEARDQEKRRKMMLIGAVVVAVVCVALAIWATMG